MRNLLIVMALALLASCSAGDVVKVSGVVENSTDSKVEVFYYKNFITNDTEMVEVELDENNAFTAEISLKEASMVNVRNSRRMVPLYLHPGSEVHVHFDAGDMDAVAQISGDKVLESNVLLNYEAEVGSKYLQQMVLMQAAEYYPHAFRVYANEIREEKMGFLESHENFSALDPAFVSLMRNRTESEQYALLMDYPAYYRHYSDDPQPIPDDFYSFMDEVEFRDEYTNTRAYVAFAGSYLRTRVQQLVQDGDERPRDEITFEVAQNQIGGKTRDIVLAESVVSGLSFGDFEKGVANYEKFLALNPHPDVAQIVTEKHDAAMELAPGELAPDFTLTDINGQEVSLSDFLGKVVYLDFWASWCGPCMQQVPFAKELKKRMEGQDDLVFLYISVDTDEDAWRRKVDEEEIRGVHLNVPGFAHDVPQTYQLRGVPTFYLIGRDGRIFDNRPPRPSFPNVDEVLLAALAQ